MHLRLASYLNFQGLQGTTQSHSKVPHNARFTSLLPHQTAARQPIRVSLLDCAARPANSESWVKPIASRPVTKLNDYDYYHGQHVVLRPLRILWDTMGIWPDGESDCVRDEIVEDLKRLNKEAGEQEGRERGGKRAKAEREEHLVTRSDIRAEVHKMASNRAKTWYWPDRPRTELGAMCHRKGVENKSVGQERPS